MIIDEPSINEAGRIVQSLDGSWQVVFDENNEGVQASWNSSYVFRGLDSLDIPVPSSLEEHRQDYEGVAWYFRTFAVPATWEGRLVRVTFDAVNYLCEIWVNGEQVGRHEGGYTPFSLRIDEQLLWGQDNVITVRVITPLVTREEGIGELEPNSMPHWRGGITGGIWQSVRLVATAPQFVDDLYIQPHIDTQTAEIQATLVNSGPEAKLVTARVTIADATSSGGPVANREREWVLQPGENLENCSLQIPYMQTWSPSNPHLYRADIRILDGDQLLDSFQDRFGMREFTIRDNAFFLNGEPLYLKATFFEGLYPNRIAYPDSEAMARKEIQLAKEAGFNMIRPWRKQPPPMWLDLADEKGVMVVGALPIECMNFWPAITPHLGRRIGIEVRETVLRDRNRACVVQWELFNEIFRDELAVYREPMSELARSLDPSRLVLDESGSFAGVAKIHLPYSDEVLEFNDVHTYPGAPVSAQLVDGFVALAMTEEEKKEKGLGKSEMRSKSKQNPGLMTYVSEVGYGSLPDLEANNRDFMASGNELVPAYRYHRDLAESLTQVMEESGFSKIFPNLKEFTDDSQAIHARANKLMLEGARMNSRIAGYCLHALTDGDWILGAGLLDLFRNPKAPYYTAQAVNQPRYLVVRALPRTVYADQGTRIQITGINELEALSGSLVVEWLDSAGNVIHESQAEVELQSGITELVSEHQPTEGLLGSYEVRARLLDENGKSLVENSTSLDVFEKANISELTGPVAFLGRNPRLVSYLEKHGFSIEEFSEETPQATPVFVYETEESLKADLGDSLRRFIEDGGIAVYDNPLKPKPNWGMELISESLLPVRPLVEGSQGLWTGVSHLVREHPLVKGLPGHCSMGQAYENVYATNTLRNLESDPVIASVSYSIHEHGYDRNYLGPGEAWIGSDLSTVHLGEGQLLISTLSIVDHLGSDPVADKILFNMVNFVANQ